MTCLMLLLSLLGTAQAETPESFGAELAELRSEVETLGEDIALDKESLRAKLRGLEATEADLQARIREEELRLQQLKLELTKQQEQVAASAGDGEALLPTIKAGIAGLRPLVEQGLPYRTQERLDALTEIEDKLAAGTLPAHKALSRLWQFSEDELRLCRENALDRQVIRLGGQDVLAEVARVGMIAMYFRTEDGRVGWADNQGGEWTYTEGTSQDAQDLAVLFDSLSKQIRVGWFDLPHAIPAEVN